MEEKTAEREWQRNAVEAILMVAEGPVPVSAIARACLLPDQAIVEILLELKADYADRGFALREVAGGWRIYSRPAYDEVITRFLQGERTTTLSQAALETLAVIAYRQPVARATISAIRGVNVDAVSRTLEAHGLIERAGHNSAGATLWQTTDLFLEVFGLHSLSELPPLAPNLPDMEQLEDIIEKLEENSGGSTSPRG